MGANTNKTIVGQIQELAARPEGIGSTDMPGIASADLSARCCALVRRGILHRAGSGRGKMRYFATAEAAAAYDEASGKPDLTLPTISQVSTKASWAKDAKTVITEKTKVTICPPLQPRFQAVDLPHVHAANQRGRM